MNLALENESDFQLVSASQGVGIDELFKRLISKYDIIRSQCDEESDDYYSWCNKKKRQRSFKVDRESKNENKMKSDKKNCCY